MKRITRSDGSNYFDHQCRKKEKQLIRSAYRKIEESYWALEDLRDELYKLMLEPEFSKTSANSCWGTLADIFTVTAHVTGRCEVFDPDLNSYYDDDLDFSEDIDDLFGFFLKIRTQALVLICRKRSISSLRQYADMMTIGVEATQLLQTITNKYEKILDIAMELCKSTVEVFCQLCPGDTLFSGAQNELVQLGVVK